MKHPPKQGLYDPNNEHENCGMGFIVDMKGRKSHEIIQGALEICVNLDHRGGCGCDPITGDGAGIFMQLPDKFLRRVAFTELSLDLPPEGDYGVGFIYFSKANDVRIREKEVTEQVFCEEGIEILGWRDVPVDSSILGKASFECEPSMEHVFVKHPDSCERGLSFERKLYLARRIITHRLRYGSESSSEAVASRSVSRPTS